LPIICSVKPTPALDNEKSLIVVITINLKPVYINPNYGGWFGYSVLALFVVWLVLKIIKVFFYIATGNKPKASEFKKLI
jgi:hypothetical protein